MLKIFTLNWNGEDKLKKLAPSLFNSLNNIDYEWYVKDNASKDGSVNYLKSLNNPRILIFEYQNNLQNFSEGMNYLFSLSKAEDNDLILLLNNDVIFNDQSSLHKMINIITHDDNVGVVGAKLLYTNSNLLQHAGVVIGEDENMPIHYKANEPDTKNSSQNRLFQIVTGAVLLTKAKYFKKVCTNNKSGIDGMNEQYHWAFDDVDFCLSIHYSLDKKIVYCGETSIFHEESASLKKNPVNKMYMSHNANLLRSKWASTWKKDHNLYIKNGKYNLYK